jgi:hypothetical protein
MGFLNKFVQALVYDAKVDITIKFFISLILLGCIIKILTTSVNQSDNSGGIGEATGTIWGYLIILLSLIGLIIMKVDSSTNSTQQILNNTIGIPWYFYFLTAIIIWTIYLNINYYKEINKHNTPPNYSYWNTWNTVFIMFVVGFIIVEEVFKVTDKFSNSEKNNKMIQVSIGFLLFLMFIINGIQHTILQNFTVDG